ncbi:MAG: hypothetical protein WEA58_07910 [Balneolaceae bacterium]
MDKNRNITQVKENLEKESKKKKMDEALDRELEQTFPASDPPSHSRPDNDDKKSRK